MRLTIGVSVGLLLGLFHYVSSQCDGREKIISTGSGAIQSPNYQNEHGHEANCTWKFMSPDDGESYLLNLTVVYQRFYFTKDGNNHRTGSYNLTIANEIRGHNFIGPTKPESKFFQTSNVCGHTAQLPPSGILVEYISDGRKAPSGYSATHMGFRIEYSFVKCGTETTSKTPETSTSLVTTVTQRTTNAVEPNSSAAPETTKVISTSSADATDKNSVTSSVSQQPNSDGLSDKTKLILVSIPGFVGILILIAAAIICFKDNGKNYNIDRKDQARKNVDSVEMENQEKDPEQNAIVENDDLPLPPPPEETDGAAMYSTVVRKTEGGEKETVHL